jgi:hypothetical protein
MKCREVEEVLATSNTGETGNVMQSVRAHIEECKNCQEFARIVELPSADAEIDPGEIERLQKMIVGDLRPVRPLPPPWIFFAAFAVIFVALSCIGGLYLGPYDWFVLMPAQRIAVFATLAGSAGLLAFSLVRQMVPGQKSLLRPGLLPVPIFVLLSLAVAAISQMRTDPIFFRQGEKCFKAGAPYAIPAAFVFWLILRRGSILSPRAVGAITGMLAGLVSTTVLEVHCPYLNLWHILVWHVGIALLGLVTGLLVATAGQAIRNRVS